MNLLKLINARRWMKVNEPFLKSWHAYVGYELDLYKAFARPAQAREVARMRDLDAELLGRWLHVGVAIGYLKRRKDGAYQRVASWRLPSEKGTDSSGVILKDIMELHIPTMLAYPDLMRTKTRLAFDSEAHGPHIAETSRLLEFMALPKVERYLRALHNGQAGGRVLDLGCGEAGYIRALAPKFPDVSFCGVELNEEVAEKARRLTAELPNAAILCGDLWAVRPPGALDLVLMNSLIHYIPPERRLSLFQAIAHHLAEGGRLCVNTPIVGRKKDKPFVTAFDAFFHSFSNLYPLPSADELERTAARAGLLLERTETIAAEGSWYFLTFQKRASRANARAPRRSLAFPKG